MGKLTSAIVIVAFLLTVAFFAMGLPGLSEVDGWFYRPRDRRWDLALASMVFVVAPMIFHFGRGLWARGGMGRRALATCTWVALAFALQLGTTFVSGERWGEVWSRHVQGHGEFFRTARARRGTFLETLRNYDELAETGQLGAFAKTKPPGALAIYMGIDALAQVPWIADWLEPLEEDASLRPGAATVAGAAALSSLLMPFATAFLVVPLLWLAAEMSRRREVGPWTLALAFTSPAILLISYHLDGAVYPAIAVLCAALAAHGVSRGRYWASVLAGACLAVGIWITFSLFGAVILVLVVLAAKSIALFRTTTLSRASLRLGFHGLGILSGFVATLFTLSSSLGFQLLRRYDSAMAVHERWKGAVPTALWRGMSLIEFGLYVGVPLATFFLLVVAVAAYRLARRTEVDTALFAVGVFVVLVALAAVSGTNEVARLWLFMVPFIALAVASVGMTARGSRGSITMTGSVIGAAAPGPAPSPAPSSSSRVGQPVVLGAPLWLLAVAQLLLTLWMKAHQVW